MSEADAQQVTEPVAQPAAPVAQPDVQPAAQRNPMRFSIGTMLLVVTIACLATALLLNQRRIGNLERQLKATLPLSVDEVARQFEERTTMGAVTTTVNDVRYSEEKDTYKVRFSWTVAKSKNRWKSEVFLEPDGYGAYHGTIRSSPYLTSLGRKFPFAVEVQTPSPLTRKP